MQSIKQLVRTPIRTGLFILFLAGATAFLCLGLYMWVSVNSSLEQIAESFTTAGIIEYSPPQGHTIASTDSEIIMNSPHVEKFDHREWLPAYGKDLKPATSLYSPLGTRIIFFEVQENSSKEALIIRVLEVRPAYSRWLQETRLLAGATPNLEKGKRYVAACSFDDDRNAFHLVGTEFFPVTEFPEGSPEEFLASTGGREWAELLEAFRRYTDSLTALTTEDLDIVYAFHQGDAVLAKGRSFTPEEYQQSAPVCVVSVDFATLNDLHLGNTIELTFYKLAGLSWRSDTGVLAGLDCFRGPIGGGEYEIIGMYVLPRVTRGDWYRIDANTVIIPQDPAISLPQWVDNNLVSCRLTNGTASTFLAEIEAAALPGISIAIYDQGYSKASNALTAMSKTALTLISICLLAGMVLSLLFALLYVNRQKRTIATMYSLGATPRQAVVFIAITVCLITLLAATLGTAVGYGLSNTALNSVYQKLIRDNPVDTAYSTVAAGAAIQYEVVIPAGLLLPTIAAGTIIFLTLCASAVFSYSALTAEPLRLLAEKGD